MRVAPADALLLVRAIDLLLAQGALADSERVAMLDVRRRCISVHKNRHRDRAARRPRAPENTP